MTEFLPKDAAKAVIEIKEKLYERLDRNVDAMAQLIMVPGEDCTLTITALRNENDFLVDLLDLIERS